MQLTNNLQGQDGLKQKWVEVSTAADVAARTDNHKGWVAPLLAVLVVLTAVAVGSLSVWLVPPYLALMSLLLADFMPRSLPGRHRFQPHSLKPSGLQPRNSLLDGESASPTIESSGSEEVPSPEIESSEEVAAQDALRPAQKPKRSRSRSKKDRAPLAPLVVARWVQVAPGKFVRVEGPSDETPASEISENVVAPLVSLPDHDLEARAEDRVDADVALEPSSEPTWEQSLESSAHDEAGFMGAGFGEQQEFPGTSTEAMPGETDMLAPDVEEDPRESLADEEPFESTNDVSEEWPAESDLDVDESAIDECVDELHEDLDESEYLAGHEEEASEAVDDATAEIDATTEESVEDITTVATAEPGLEDEEALESSEESWDDDTEVDEQPAAECEMTSDWSDQAPDLDGGMTVEDEVVEETPSDLEPTHVCSADSTTGHVDESDEEWRVFEAEYNKMYPPNEADLSPESVEPVQQLWEDSEIEDPSSVTGWTMAPYSTPGSGRFELVTGPLSRSGPRGHSRRVRTTDRVVARSLQALRRASHRTEGRTEQRRRVLKHRTSRR